MDLTASAYCTAVIPGFSAVHKDHHFGIAIERGKRGQHAFEIAAALPFDHVGYALPRMLEFQSACGDVELGNNGVEDSRVARGHGLAKIRAVRKQRSPEPGTAEPTPNIEPT